MFVYRGNIEIVKEAVFQANRDTSWELIRENLITKESFDMSTLKPYDVYLELRKIK